MEPDAGFLPHILNAYKTNSMAIFVESHREEINDDLIQALRTEAENQSGLKDALDILDCGAYLAEAFQRNDWLNVVWRGRASVYSRHEHYQESFDASEKAASLCKDDPIQEAIAQILQVFTLGVLGHYAKAVALAEKLYPFFQDMPLAQAYLSANLAQVYEWYWQLEKAQHEAEKAYTLFHELGNVSGGAEILHNLAIIAEKQEAYTLARTYYERAYEDFLKLEDHRMLIKTKSNMALLSIQIDKLEDTLQFIMQARSNLERITETNNLPAYGYLDYAEARVRHLLGSFNEAVFLYKQALQRFAYPGYHADRIEAQMHLASLLESTGNLTEAVRLRESTERNLETVDAPVFRANVQLELAKFYLRLGKIHEAQAKAETAYEALKEVELPLRQAYALYILADISSTNDPIKAQTLYQLALRKCQDKLPLLAANCWIRLGQLAQEKNHLTEAETNFIQAIDSLNVVHSELSSHENKAGLFEDKQVLFEQLLAVLRKQSTKKNQLIQWTEKIKANALAELIQASFGQLELNSDLASLLAERERVRHLLQQHEFQLVNITKVDSQLRGESNLNNHDAHHSTELRKAHLQLKRLNEQIAHLQNQAQHYRWYDGVTIETVRDIHALLDPDSLFISYYSIGEQLCALTIGKEKDDIQDHLLNVPLTEIEKKWRQSKQFVAQGNTSIAAVQKRLAYFWEHLIAPLTTRLNQKKRLIISPYRSLFLIPFAGLYDTLTNQYMVERWQLQVVPSATVWYWTQQYKTKGTHPLLIGHPQAHNLPYLKHVETELDTIKQILPEADILWQPKAHTVLSLMHNRSLIHLAGHIVYDARNPLESGIPLHDSWISASDLYFRPGYIPGATVVLSGCDSGQMHSSGNEILGLIGAFLSAGASNVVGSLWPIDDEATKEIMTAFYEQTANGEGTVAALQKAQLTLLYGTNTGDKYQHPRFWASFVLNGNGQQLSRNHEIFSDPNIG